jgi:hypothetical protein
LPNSEAAASPKTSGVVSSDGAEGERILDKVRVSHQREADQYCLPKMQSLAEDEADEADAAEDQTKEKIRCRDSRKIGHAFLRAKTTPSGPNDSLGALPLETKG